MAFVPALFVNTVTNIVGNDGVQASDDEQRRGLLRSLLVSPLISATAGAAIAANPRSVQASDDTTTQTQTSLTDKSSSETLTVPLKWIPSLSAYVVTYSVGGERFGGIVDTGSPFLVVPNYCNRQKYGCYDPENSRPSGFPSTLERFDNNEGEVEWKIAPFSFVGASGSMMGPKEMVFGVLSESLMNGSGGVFFGLIRDTDAWIRPSFLGQTNVKAMEIDLRGDPASSSPNSNKTLTLYTQASQLLRSNNNDSSDLARSDYIPLVRDLNRKYGDPVIHYTSKASACMANGNSVLQRTDKRPIYVIFDTGVTGMVVSRDLFDQRYKDARQNREKSLWGSVEVAFQTHEGNTVSLSAKKPVTTPLGMKPWPKFNNAHLIVLGLSFLDGHRIAIDMDGRKLWLS